MQKGQIAEEMMYRKTAINIVQRHANEMAMVEIGFKWFIAMDVLVKMF